MFIILHMLSHFFNPSRENRNLNFRRTNVVLIPSNLGNSFRFILFCNHTPIIPHPLNIFNIYVKISLMENPEDKIILIDKPAGISSFSVVAKVRNNLRATFGKKVKVGHTGTLDPFATGLLILLSGKMTKRSNEFLKQDKTYEATIFLGKTSTTGDPEGEITPVSDKVPTKSEIETCLKSFLGKIAQTVPSYSAVKINGERAYKLARAGKTFETPTRTVTIYSLELLEYHYPLLKIRTHVSSGTYIRTLGEDIGQSLGTGAYLTTLRRTEIGTYSLSSATPLSDYRLP